MTEIKLCPHCGGDRLTVYVDKYDTSYIECADCHAAVLSHVCGCTDGSVSQILDLLIENWNRRAEEEEI